MDSFDLEIARQQEAERRFQMLGDYAETDYDRKRLHSLASKMRIPVRYLVAWKQAFRLSGLKGLLPQNWEPLTEREQQIVSERLVRLGKLADAPTLTDHDIAELAKQQAWSFRVTERWLLRYRVGGVWALAPRYDPEKKPSSKSPPIPALAALAKPEEDKVFQEIDRKRLLLGESILEKLQQGSTITDKEVEERAKTVGKSKRSLWNYISNFRKHDILGLARRRRSDKGRYHMVSERMESVIRGLRLSKVERTLAEVYKEACKRAQALGEPEPSEWQVRRICANIPKEILALADQNERKYRNTYRITHRRRFEATRIIYQLDATQITMLAIDKRQEEYQTKSKQARPWLTLCIDCSSRLLLAARFSYEPPDQHIIASVISDALLVTEEHPYGGTPDEIWVDRGKPMIAEHVRQMTRALGIHLHLCKTAEEKGIVERFFRTLDTRLWATLPGFVNSTVEKRHPKAKAKHTLPELVSAFWDFIKIYHNEVHSQTGSTPLQAWANCFALPPDPRKLDILRQVASLRKVHKEGIKYAGRIYWHRDLSNTYVGEYVLIRAEPEYTKPDAIEVYHQDQWICTAIATDSELGLMVTGQQVVEAQRQQRKKGRQYIQSERNALESADQEIALMESLRQKQQSQQIHSEQAPLSLQSNGEDTLASEMAEKSLPLTRQRQEFIQNHASPGQSLSRGHRETQPKKKSSEAIWSELTALREKENRAKKRQ